MEQPTTVATVTSRALEPLNRRLAAAVGGPARRRVVLLFACVLGLDSADKATLGAVAGELKPELHIGNTELGLLATATAAVSALATVPMGVVTDRATRVRLLALSVVLWSVAMGWGACAGSFAMLLASRLALGAVVAAAGPVVASLVGDFFSPDERARIYGYILSGELIGSGVGFLIAGNLAGLLSWRFSFWALAGAGVALAWTIRRRLREPERGGQGRLARDATSFRDRPPAPRTERRGRSSPSGPCARRRSSPSSTSSCRTTRSGCRSAVRCATSSVCRRTWC